MADPLSNSKNLNLAPLCGLMAACCLFGPLFIYGLASLAVWGDGTPATLRLPAILGGTSWIVAAAIGIALVAYAARGKVANLGFPIMAASIIRMFIALSLGLVLYFVFKGDGKTFWFSFLVTGLACLIVETAWAVRTLTAPNVTSSDGVHS